MIKMHARSLGSFFLPQQFAKFSHPRVNYVVTGLKIEVKGIWNFCYPLLSIDIFCMYAYDRVHSTDVTVNMTQVNLEIK